MATLANPPPAPLVSQSSLGPFSSQDLSRPVSFETPVRSGPRHCGQSSALTVCVARQTRTSDKVQRLIGTSKMREDEASRGRDQPQGGAGRHPCGLPISIPASPAPAKSVLMRTILIEPQV